MGCKSLKINKIHNYINCCNISRNFTLLCAPLCYFTVFRQTRLGGDFYTRPTQSLKWFLVTSYPSQLVPESTRTLFGQLVPKSTRILVNSYPSQLVPFLKHGYYGSVCYLIHLYIVASVHPPLPHHVNGKGNHFRPR